MGVFAVCALSQPTVPFVNSLQKGFSKAYNKLTSFPSIESASAIWRSTLALDLVITLLLFEPTFSAQLLSVSLKAAGRELLPPSTIHAAKC